MLKSKCCYVSLIISSNEKGIICSFCQELCGEFDTVEDDTDLLKEGHEK